MSFTTCPAAVSLNLGAQCRVSSAGFKRVAIGKGFKSSRAQSAACVRTTTRCSAASSKEEASRRNLMLSSAAAFAVSSLPSLPAMAEVPALTTFYGAANPPATPGKLGGTTKAKARYSFDYPETWVEEVISKVEKGTNGTDVRLIGPKSKKEKVFVLTLLNFGGKKGFTMDQPAVPLLQSLTGSLFFFQDALADGELTARTIQKDGKKYYEYKLEGSDSYLIQITVEDGRVFGFFLNASAKGFASDSELFRTMADSFVAYPNVPGADDRA